MWHYYPEHYMFSYQLVRILAQAHFGGGEFNECIEAASRITPGNFESFHQSWNKSGDAVLQVAEQALAGAPAVENQRFRVPRILGEEE